jgi:hypothetical protein
MIVCLLRRCKRNVNDVSITSLQEGKTCKSKMYAIIKRVKLGITLTGFNPPPELR